MLYGHINTSSSLSICLLSPLHFVCFFFSSICFVLIYFPISTIHLETASLWHFAATVVASFISFTAKLYYNMHKSAFESCQSMKSVSALERFNFYGTLKMNKLLITVKWLARNQTQYVYAVDWMECARASAQCKLIRLISIQSGFSNCRNRYFEERIQLNATFVARMWLLSCTDASHEFMTSWFFRVDFNWHCRGNHQIIAVLLFTKSISTSFVWHSSNVFIMGFRCQKKCAGKYYREFENNAQRFLCFLLETKKPYENWVTLRVLLKMPNVLNFNA